MCKLIDSNGATLASQGVVLPAANNEVTWGPIVRVSLTGSATFSAQARDTSSASGQIIATSSVPGAAPNLATFITYWRVL
jgi:hypothetical protein